MAGFPNAETPLADRILEVDEASRRVSVLVGVLSRRDASSTLSAPSAKSVRLPQLE